MDTSAWVTWPERPKGAKDKGPQKLTREVDQKLGPGGPPKLLVKIINNDKKTQEEADIASMNWKINIEEIQMPDR